MNNHPKVCATATVYVMSYYFVSSKICSSPKTSFIRAKKRLYFSLDSSLYNLSFDSTSNTTPFNVRWPGNHSHARTIQVVKRFLVLLK